MGKWADQYELGRDYPDVVAQWAVHSVSSATVSVGKVRLGRFGMVKARTGAAATVINRPVKAGMAIF